MSRQRSYLLLMRKNTISVLTLSNGGIEFVKFHGLTVLDAKKFWDDQDSFWDDLMCRESIENDDLLNISFVFDEKFSLEKLHKEKCWLQNWIVDDIERVVSMACEGNVLLHFPKGKSFEKVILRKNNDCVTENLYVLGFSLESLKNQRKKLQDEPIDIPSNEHLNTEMDDCLGFDYFDGRMKEYEGNRVCKKVPKQGGRIEVDTTAKKKVGSKTNRIKKKK